MGRTKPRNTEIGTIKDSALKSSIFQSFFGDISHHATATSTFSDSNPFRRKLTERTAQIPNLQEDIPAEHDNDGSQDRFLMEKKSKKRKGDRKVGDDSDSSGENSKIALVKKKAKNNKEDDAGRTPNFASVVTKIKGSKIGEQKKEKKRKREAVEREYEEKHYLIGKDDAKEDNFERKVGEKRKMVDKVDNTLVRKEGFDDESKLLRTVFVGNLPLKMKTKSLLKEFKQFGKIESLRIRSVPLVDCKIPRKGAIIQKKFNDSIDSVHAYIVFNTEQSAQASLAHNMSVFCGNHIRVDRACPPRKKLKSDSSGAPLYDSKRTLFLGNLPFDVKDEEIYKLFCNMSGLESSVEGVRVIRDPHTSIGKGIAYVLFKTKEAANLVSKRRYLKVRDREVRVAHAKSESLLDRKRKNTQPSNDFPAKKTASDWHNLKDGYEKRKGEADASSYQGLRGCKSGSEEKMRRLKVGSTLPPQKHKPKAKERTSKRPAVAARKARQLALKNAGASSSGGQKRKQRQTPEGSSAGRGSKKIKR